MNLKELIKLIIKHTDITSWVDIEDLLNDMEIKIDFGMVNEVVEEIKVLNEEITELKDQRYKLDKEIKELKGNK